MLQECTRDTCFASRFRRKKKEKEKKKERKLKTESRPIFIWGRNDCRARNHGGKNKRFCWFVVTFVCFFVLFASIAHAKQFHESKESRASIEEKHGKKKERSIHTGSRSREEVNRTPRDEAPTLKDWTTSAVCVLRIWTFTVASVERVCVKTATNAQSLSEEGEDIESSFPSNGITRAKVPPFIGRTFTNSPYHPFTSIREAKMIKKIYLKSEGAIAANQMNDISGHIWLQMK